MKNQSSDEDTLNLIGSDIPDLTIESASDAEALKEKDQFYSRPFDEKKRDLERTQLEQSAAFQEQLVEARSISRLRQSVVRFIFGLIFVWLLCVMGLVFLGSYDVTHFYGACDGYGMTDWFEKFKLVPEGCSYLRSSTYLALSESIVIALITTTTANVLGLSFIVSRWLFPSKDNTEK
jgi:ABC-type Fe3+ transport system permease subunit